jgi:hypothetical protein
MVAEPITQVDTYDEGGISINDLEKAIDELIELNNDKLPPKPKIVQIKPEIIEQPIYQLPIE